MEIGSAFLSLMPPNLTTSCTSGALILPTLRHTRLRSEAKAFGLEWSIWPSAEYSTFAGPPKNQCLSHWSGR